MEDWRKKHIEKNLPALIDLTTCSVGLIAGLRSKELLTKEEDERLTALAGNQGLTCAAKMLYEIMMTRSKGYSGLMEVLRETRQDGALKILQDGIQHPESQVSTDDSFTQLMNMRVLLANSTKSFHDVFPNFTLADARELLRNPELKQEVEKLLLKGSLKIRLDGELPLVSDLYISRQLSNRLQLDPKIFTFDSCEDVFVFTNISRMELAKLVKPYAVRSSTNQRSLVTGRHIYLDDEEDWEDMVALSQSPIHLVSKEEELYILQRTTRVTDVLQKYSLREGRSKEAFVTEDAFLEVLVSDDVSKGALICDVAGMGKTWLMQSLATKLRDKNESFFVFYIDLPLFSKLLTAKNDTPPDNPALAVVLRYAGISKLASHLLQKYAVQNALQMVFVFDGYDELNRDGIEVVKSSLSVFSKLDHIKLIISSRPNMRASLQKTFNLISFDILPFQTEEQVRCLTEHWANVCPQTDSQSYKLKEFALQCIKSVKSIQNDDIHDFLGVPLKCRILATVNEQQAKQLCKVTRQKPFLVAEAATIESVFDLYTRFVDTLVDKIARTMPENNRNDFVNGILKFYTHMALELLFPDLSNVYLENCKIDSSMEEFFRRAGVASLNNVNQRLEFIHRSFAEYFVGRFFANFWNEIEQFSPSFVHMVGSYFIKNVLIAVDGEFRIQSKQSNELWNLIKYSDWEYRFIPPFLVIKKVFQLKHPLTLQFMNMNLNGTKLPVVWLERPTNRFGNVALSFETETITTTQSLQPVDRNTNYCDQLCELKKWLTKFTFVTMTACIDERLTNILSLYVQILISFVDPENRVALLLSSAIDENKKRKAAAAWLLCRAAMSKSPEIAVEVFNLFRDSKENFLSVLCQRYPKEYVSPLEVAIITEDLDMVLYFMDKVSLPFFRLFFTCLAVDKKPAEPDVDAKLKIMNTVLGSSERVMDVLCADRLYSCFVPGRKLTKYSFQLLLKFLEDSKRSISSITGENKRFFLEQCLEYCNDEELVNLLLSLYGISDEKKHSIVNLPEGRAFTSEEVLDALDLEVIDVFSEVLLSYFAFDDCSNLETLKVLTAIQPDFSSCNYYKWNYLHVAAYTLNIDWVRYLIKLGDEVDQPDVNGDTPLLCTTSYYHNYRTGKLKSLLAVTRLLVENGANVYATDRMGENIAHRVFCSCLRVDNKNLCEWVSYLLENGYHQLWEMRDDYGRTPQEQLISDAGKDSPITTDVLRLLESHSVVSMNDLLSSLADSSTTDSE